MQKCQEGLDEKTRSDFFSDSVDLLHYNLHKIGLNRGVLKIDSPKWWRNKKQQ